MPLILALVALLVLAPAALARKPAPKSPAQVDAYWTDARMKDAKPRQRAKPGGGGGGKTTSDWSRFTVPTPYGTQDRLNGKLFFTLDGGRYVCSGTAVAATSGVNLVWTAGHCVTDGVQNGVEHKATDFLFVPAYLNGAEPYGRWTGTSSDSTPGWEGSGGTDFRYDVGAIRVTNPAAPGATFASTIGTRPIAFGGPALGSKVVSYGYPASGKFKGTQQYACASTVRRYDPYDPTSPAPVQIGCDMTGGSSGGGWVSDANGNRRADAGEPLVSVNSYGYGFESSTMYGPQMPAGGQAQALYAAMD